MFLGCHLAESTDKTDHKRKYIYVSLLSYSRSNQLAPSGNVIAYKEENISTISREMKTFFKGGEGTSKTEKYKCLKLKTHWMGLRAVKT